MITIHEMDMSVFALWVLIFICWFLVGYQSLDFFLYRLFNEKKERGLYFIKIIATLGGFATFFLVMFALLIKILVYSLYSKGKPLLTPRSKGDEKWE